MDPFQPILKLKLREFTSLFEGHKISIDAEGLVEEWTKANKEINYPHIGHFIQAVGWIVQGALDRLAVAPDVAAHLGLELLGAYRAGLKELIASDPRTKQVKETLGRLKDRRKRLGGSNDRIVGLGLTLHCMGIQACFEYIETSESIGIEKPDPRVFDDILDWFRLPPNLITYVGDDPIRDIDAAKKKNLNAVWYWWTLTCTARIGGIIKPPWSLSRMQS